MTKKNDGLDKFLDWAANQPPSSPEEKATNEAARKAMEGKWLETVTMNEDGSLMIVSKQYLPGGGIADGASESRPGDSDYDEILRQHGLLKPGKAHTLVRKMVDGNWILLRESDEVVQPETFKGNAVTAAARQNALRDWLSEQEKPTPEEIAKFRAERKALEGKWLETVTMRNDRSLMIVTTRYLEDGGIAEGCTKSAPDDPDYDELLHRHGALTPGKSHTLIRKMIDGSWITLPESDPVTQADDSSQPTA